MAQIFEDHLRRRGRAWENGKLGRRRAATRRAEALRTTHQFETVLICHVHLFLLPASQSRRRAGNRGSPRRADTATVGFLTQVVVWGQGGRRRWGRADAGLSR